VNIYQLNYETVGAKSEPTTSTGALMVPSTGYDSSTLSYHPYLIGAQQGAEMMDALAAGQTVTASAPMSGPYVLAAFGDALFLGERGPSA
jgi:hypothetical protein